MAINHLRCLGSWFVVTVSRPLKSHACKSWMVRLPPLSTAESACFLGRFFKYGQDITGWVFEPRDQWSAAAKNSLCVGFEVTLIALKAHTSVRELVYSFFNIVDGEIENG